MQQVRADWVHDVIYSGDVCQVADMIAHTAITKKELSQYCDFADHVITIRRDNLSYKVLEAEHGLSEKAAILALACAIACSTTINEKDWSLWFHLKSGVLTGIFTGISVSVVSFFKESSRKNAYVNALHIQKLLHDYEEVFVAKLAIAASND